MKKKTKRIKDNHKKMCDEIIRYVENKSGKVFIIGGIRVREREGLKHNFTFEIDFIGNSPK